MFGPLCSNGTGNSILMRTLPHFGIQISRPYNFTQTENLLAYAESVEDELQDVIVCSIAGKCV